MPFRNIVVENPARISVKNSQLIIHTDSDHSVAIEDISALLLESRQTTITAAALSTLGECGCCVFTCDEKHRLRLKERIPKNGAIRMLVITEKQYESIEILLGSLTQADESFESEVLTVF